MRDEFQTLYGPNGTHGGPLPDNPMLSEAFATLRLHGTDWQPEDITERLGITPSYAHRLGEQHGSKGLIWKDSCWHITSRHQVASTNLEEHIAWVLDRIEPVCEAFMAIRRALPSADIFCMVVSRYGHGGPGFTPRLLGRLAALDLTLGLDIYFGNDEKSDGDNA